MKKILTSLFILMTCNFLHGQIFVDKDATAGMNNGTSWANAYVDLQVALDAASAGAEIWVAAGIYLPTEAPDISVSNNRYKAFHFDKDLRVYGGFAGTESLLSQRDPVANEVTLSGDFLQDDFLSGSGLLFSLGNTSENAYNVMVLEGLPSTAIIDGFTISGGSAEVNSAFGYSGKSFFPANGGGIHAISCRHQIRNCIITANEASNLGGGVFIESGPIDVINCLFYYNKATNGGAIYNFSSDLEVINCTFTFNEAGSPGDAIYNANNSQSSVVNSIFWSNVNSPVFNDAAPATISIDNSIYDDGILDNTINLPTGASGSNNIETDPLFVDASNNDFTLTICSPAVNVGDNSAVSGILTDLSGGVRVELLTVDFGAYEYQIPTTAGRIYVDLSNNAACDNDGSSWDKAFTDLQIALDVATNNPAIAEIWVAQGTYYPSKDINGIATPNDRDNTFYISRDGIKIYGGFAGTETSLSERMPQSNRTILSGDYNNDDVLSFNAGLSISNNSENAYRVLHIDGTTTNGNITAATLIDGFTIQGGNEDNTGVGAGLFINGSGSGNEASPRISNCKFIGHQASGEGGAVRIDAQNSGTSNPLFANCAFYRNLASRAGAFYTVSRNGNSSPRVINSVFVENTASIFADAYIYNGDIGTGVPVVQNCTFQGNAGVGTALLIRSVAPFTSTILVENCIFWNTGATPVSLFGSATGTINNSIIDDGNPDGTLNGTGGYTLTNCLDLDPVFINQADPDGADNLFCTADDGLALSICSPAINAGLTTSPTIPTDLLGNARAFAYDMGAYEYQPLINAGRIYVDIDNNVDCGNDGSSWDKAFTDLQSAIDVASISPSIAEIWVAEGTYLPTEAPDGSTSDLRQRAFHLATDMKIYGGFQANETMLSQRDPATYLTTLSGDFNQNDVFLNTDDGDFTNDGYQNNTGDDNAYHIMITTGLTNAALIDGFTFRGGNANTFSLDINYAGQRYFASTGGGQYNIFSSPTLAHCTFSFNAGVAGAGQNNEFQSSPILTDCNFYNNSSRFDGGGQKNETSSSPRMTNCIWDFNFSISGSGAGQTNESSSSPIMINCLYINNVSRASGGGQYNLDDSSPNLINCVFTKNKGGASGGAQESENGSFPILTNCIIWGNTTSSNLNPNVGIGFIGISTFTNCIIEGSGGSTAWNNSIGDDGGNNIDADPLFTDPVNNDFTLFGCSPAINIGNNAAVGGISTDLAGGTRIVDGIVDLGAYEFDALNSDPVRLYVNQNVAGGNQSGKDWANAFTDLQTALDVVQTCTQAREIWVAAGTYLPSRAFDLDEDGNDPGEVTFYINTDGLKIYGGFNGTETTLAERNVLANPTILDGDLNQDDVSGLSGSDLINNASRLDNAFHVVLINATGTSGSISSSTILDGFTIQNGNARGMNLPNQIGGGIFNLNSSRDTESSPTISNCSFIRNSAMVRGGGLAQIANDGTVDGIVSNCVFRQNYAGLGGAIDHAGFDGGICSPQVTNCTFYQNEAFSNGGAINSDVANPAIQNCIFWENLLNNSNNVAGADIGFSPPTTLMPVVPTVSFSLTQENSNYSTGTGIINNQDPRFENATSNDLNLTVCSPALDVGDNNAISGLNEDLAGNARTVNTTVDLGAFEFQLDINSFSVLYVDQNATSGNNTGLDWANAFTDLQSALDLIPSCRNIREIWVAAGTYFPSKTFDFDNSGGSDPREATFYINIEGLKIYGGFNGTETLLSERNIAANPTILDGDLNQNDTPGLTMGGLLNDASRSDNAYHLVFIDGRSTTITAATVLDGFSLRNGNANSNSVNGLAGGLYNRNASPIIRNCNFLNNAAFSGGGINSFGIPASILIDNCNFNGNYAMTTGGGIDLEDRAVISNCHFNNNTAESGGGVLASDNSGIDIINCSFSNNQAAEDGGGVFTESGGISNIINCSFSQNTALNGGGLFSEAGALTVSNSIFWGNSSEIALGIFPLTVENSIVQGGFVGTGNKDQDPIFVDALNNNLRLESCSAAIDMGDNTANTSMFDLDGNARIFNNGTIDMGAYEFQGAPNSGVRSILFVNVNAARSSTQDGSSWDNAFTNLQAALNAASTCTSNKEIWVAAGSYYPSQDFDLDNNARDNRNATFYIPYNDLIILGGFNGTERSSLERNVLANPTILDGDLNQNDAANLSGANLLNDASRSDNAYHVVIFDGTTSDGAISDRTVLDGFTIRNGNANGVSILDQFGGGIFNNAGAGESNPTIANCTFVNNSATLRGGGLEQYAEDGIILAALTNCVFRQNYAGLGGAIDHIGFDGGTCTPIITNCTFYENGAATGGGAIYHETANPVIQNTIFWNNQQNGAANVSGADIAGNAIISPTVNYSLTQANSNFSTGTGIINNQDPLFIDPASGDLSLQSCSPAINVGENTPVASISLDLAGNTRIVNTTVDLGAFEFQGTKTDLLLASTQQTTSALQMSSSTYFADCDNLIAKIDQSGANPISGSVTATVFFDGSVQTFLGIPYVQRHYEINPTNDPSTASGTVTLYFTQAEFDAFNANPGSILNLPSFPGDLVGIDNLRINKYSGTSAGNTGNPADYASRGELIDPVNSDIIWNAAAMRWEITFAVSGFSGFFVQTVDVSVPVELLSFTAEAVNGESHLQWQTANELNNLGFEIEKGIRLNANSNTISWQTIGFVEGNGTTKNPYEYQFVDTNPLTGNNYYRLKQLDMNGDFSYSPIRTVFFNLDSKLGIQLFPNPSNGLTNIEFDLGQATNVRLSLIDLQGRIVKEWYADTWLQTGRHKIQLEASDWIAGMYFVRLETEQTVITRPLVLQK